MSEQRMITANRTVREWARSEGLPIAAKGPIPHDIIERWRAAGAPGLWPNCPPDCPIRGCDCPLKVIGPELVT